MPDTDIQNEERDTQPTYLCLKCKDSGLQDGPGGRGFDYCTCWRGIALQDEDDSGGD